MNFRSVYRIFFCKKSRWQNSLRGMTAWLPFCWLLLLAETANAQAAFERVDLLRQKVDQFLTAEYAHTDAAKVQIRVGAVDSRLRLAACDQTLVLNLLDATGNGGNINVQVSCNGFSHWTILVPAQANVFRPVAVASRNLQRGEQITAGDLTTEVRDMSQYRQGFAIAADDLIGKEMKYAVAKGEAFRSSALGSPLVIKRADEVSLEAMAGSIRVVTNGTAASDGRMGQQIRVKNNQSERIVNARVIGPGKVQTLM